MMEGSNEATGNLLPYLEEHKVAFRIFVYKYLEPANVRMQVDKRDVYKRYFRWLETHISSQKSRFLGVNVNGTINANAPHTSLIYQISSSEVDWKALVNVRVELKELNSVFSQVWPTVRLSQVLSW
jgi:NADH:ubiquinone oxidoreductase subunit C